jgi:hypothetical protein
MAVERRIDVGATVRVLDHLVAERGATPRFVRCDNGPEFTANALRDWCRFIGAGTRSRACLSSSILEPLWVQFAVLLLTRPDLRRGLSHRRRLPGQPEPYSGCRPRPSTRLSPRPGEELLAVLS